MDTPICFLCLKAIKRDSFQLQQLVGESETYLFSSVFSKLAQEYLGLEEEVGVVLSAVFKNVSNFCEKCEVVIGSLCEMYLEHLGIQLRLRWKLSELGKLLESSKIGVSEKLESVILQSLASQVDSSVINVNRVRSLLLEKCIEKDKTSPPIADEIKVEVESSCELDDDSVFFLTHEVKKESFSSGDDLDKNDESNENWIDKQDENVKCESIQFHDETEMNEDEDDFDFVPPDRNTSPNANSSGFDSSSECESESSWEEDEKSKRKPVRKRKRSATPAIKCSKAGAQKRICTKKEFANNLQIEGWNCSICKEPTVDKASLRKHFVCHQNKAIRLDFQCTFCWRSYESKVSVDNHLLNTHMTVASDGAYSCDAPGCTLTFSNLEDLNSHAEAHLKPEKSLRICKTCGLGCLNLTRLKLHKLRHIQPIKLLSADKNAPKRNRSRLLYPCSSCDEIFPKFLELHVHFCHLHCSDLSATWYKCPNCGKSARSKQLHRCGLGRGKTKSANLVCSECDDKKEYKNWYSLQAHRRDFHIPINCSRCGETIIGLLAKEEHEEKICLDVHHCSTCGKGFTSAQRLESHMRKVHTERLFKCLECDKAFKVKLHLEDHIAALHSLERAHTCVYCGKSFATRKYLQKHLSKVHQMESSGEKKHNCPSCMESFVRKELLDSHILKCDPVAAATVLPTCEICGRPIMGGTQKALMEKHLVTHMSPQERVAYWKQQGKEDGVRVHLCPTCGKEFKKKQSLERHSAMHKGPVEKTFLCTQCPKSFPGKNHLHQHMRHVHLKSIRVAPCEICGRPVMDGFRKTMMEKHVVTHMSPQELAEYYKTKGRDFHVCLTCGKKFTKKQDLERHSNGHETKKDFPCRQCPRVFEAKFKLYNHVKNYHEKSKGA